MIFRQLVLAAILLPLPAGLTAEDSWIRLPEPDLSSLEPQVAKQLLEYRQIAAGAVTNPDAGPDDVAASWAATTTPTS